MAPINMITEFGPNLTGFAMPFIVEFINRDIKDSRIKFAITFGLCLVVAALLNLSKLSVGSVEGLINSLALIFTESQIVFKLYFNTSSLRAALQRSSTS